MTSLRGLVFDTPVEAQKRFKADVCVVSCSVSKIFCAIFDRASFSWNLTKSLSSFHCSWDTYTYPHPWNLVSLSLGTSGRRTSPGGCGRRWGFLGFSSDLGAWTGCGSSSSCLLPWFRQGEGLACGRQLCPWRLWRQGQRQQAAVPGLLPCCPMLKAPA